MKSPQMNLMAEISARLNKEGVGRSDLSVDSVQKLDKFACHALLTYNPTSQAPTTQELSAFITKEFKDKVIAVAERTQLFPEANAVLVTLARRVDTKPIEEAARMQTVLAGTRYMDTQPKVTAGAEYMGSALDNVWDVATASDGSKYLRRMFKDDISDIVAERAKRMNMVATASVQEKFNVHHALAIVEAGLMGGNSACGVGDIIRCFFEGQVYPDCEVKATKESGRKLEVMIPQVGRVTVDRGCVVNVQVAGKEAKNAVKKDESSYYKEAYGPEYGAKLTNTRPDSDMDSGFPMPRKK